MIARLIQPCSKLASVRLASRHAVLELLGMESFNEDDVYDALSWLEKEQGRIEKELYEKRYRKQGCGLFLYDVTSTYLEGDKNELANFGYNRDKKKGKKQIVIGLLTDEEGEPVSVQVYSGKTSDVDTFADQVKRTCERFGVKEVTFVGDKGMIKSKGIAKLSQHGFHYITAITKEQIRFLMNKGTIQLGLFDSEVCEVIEGGLRYILRRNPFRSDEIKHNREERIKALMKFVLKKNEYLRIHKRAKVSIGLRDVEKRAEKLKVNKWLEIKVEEREIKVKRDNKKLEEIGLLDGCYVLKTDLSKDLISAEIVHSRYKDLGLVEGAFRDMKTEHLEIRPVNVRKKNHTRAHVFIVMLAYLIRRELERCWQEVEITVKEVLMSYLNYVVFL